MRKVSRESCGAVPDGVLDTVHAPIFQFFSEAVAALGGNPVSLLKQAGIRRKKATPGPFSISYRKIAEVLELAAAELDCPDFGMRLANRQCSAGIIGPLGKAMQHSSTFGEALEVVAKHGYAHSLATAIWLERSPSGRSIMLGYDLLLDRLPVTRQVTEQIMLIGYLNTIRLTGGMVRARRILFRHQPVSTMRVYRRHFGCEVRFGQPVNATLYRDRDLSTPVVAADSKAFLSALSYLESKFPQRQPPLTVMVRGMIRSQLGTDACRTEWIAEKLGVHLRTLHRRLHDEGTSFRKIRDEVRRDMTSYFLRQTDLDFSEVSERLGFSEQSVLTHFCHKWFSASPTQLRSQTQGGTST
jgi:AraC-like DNA-binding protein